MSEILQTKDYDQFKLFPGNRAVNEIYLVDSIRRKNLLHARPILVTKDLYVIDGQHRLAAARILDVPIYYTIDETLVEDDISTLNMRQKNWMPGDFLDHYVNRGMEDYIFVKKLFDEFRFPIHFIVQCLIQGKMCYKVFNDGDLIIENKDEVYEMFSKYYEIFSLCIKTIGKGKPSLSIGGMRILWWFLNHENYNHDEFFRKCKAHPDQVKRTFSFKNQENIKDEMIRLFNFKNKSYLVSFD